MIAYAAYLLMVLLQLGLLAQATDALAGHAGRVGVSGAACAVVGGYSYALIAGASVHPLIASLLALSISLALALPAGVLLLKLRNEQFLLGTLAVHLGLLEIANNSAVFGGALGIANVPSPGSTAPETLWFALPASVAGAVILISLLRSGRFSRMVHWTRDDETSARSVGIRPDSLLLALFVAHAVLGALAGIIIVMAQGYVSPTVFGLPLALLFLTAVYVSGTGSAPMIMYVGAFVIIFLNELVREFASGPQFVGPGQQIFVSLLLLAILWLRPRGLLGPVIETGPSSGRLE